MSKRDVLKVLLMLAAAVAAVALYCYARVDLGMTQEQVNLRLKAWGCDVSTFAMVVWLQIIVAAVAIVGYRIWRHRSDVGPDEA